MRALAALADCKGYALTAAACLALGTASGWTLRDWKAGADAVDARADADARERLAIASALRVERSQAQITATVDAGAAKEAVRIRTVTQTLIKEVPVYVPVEADLRFALPVGLVRLHDAAAAGGAAIPDPARQPDGAAGNAEPSDVTPSRLGSAIVENYGICHADAARFSALQDWVRQQLALMNGP